MYGKHERIKGHAQGDDFTGSPSTNSEAKEGETRLHQPHLQGEHQALECVA